ncbi:MAG TPA: hypothetical protein VKS24_18165 [Bradyrhizobium sp.]|nr:hypothetical protein [Bradyrhizobium sp.]
MLRHTAFAVICLVATGVSAQQAPPPAEAPSAAAALPAKSVVPMEEPRSGDRWTYEVRDEITGKITESRENVVTEVTPTEISVRFKKFGTDDTSVTVYDRSWNAVEQRPWRYSPHDGTGIQSPLAVGKTWPVQTNNINSANGSIWKRSGTSKVVGQESVTTKAGTFDTFKIETTFMGSNVKNPLMKNEVTSITWYAPAIDHWVRRTFVLRANKHLHISNTIELIDYGRKE